jgi:hypothetical protein
VSWHPDDPRSWGGWSPHDPRWGRHQPLWGWGHPARPLYDNQLGHRLPSGGPPARGELSMLVALGLFLLSPLTLLAWAAGQGLLRVAGIRWWKLALTSLAALAGVVLVQGGLGPALAHHFSGYVDWLRQYGAPGRHLPMPGAFLWPQLPLAVPVGLLAAALNLAGRRQAIDPAEVKRTQRQAARRMDTAVRRAALVRDDHFGPVALGVQVDGDLGWADKRGLVTVPRLMQGRSRLIVGTPAPARPSTSNARRWSPPEVAASSSSSTARAPTPASSSGRWPATCGATPTPASASGPNSPWTAGAAPRPPSTTGWWPC